MTHSARRDSLLAIGVALAAAAVLVVWTARPARGQADALQRGRDLYVVGCSSCHGPQGEGVTTIDDKHRGPSLESSGEAAAFYELSTGRMPLADSSQQPQRKRAAYSSDDIAALTAYVGSLGNGPTLPNVDISNADIAAGGELYRANCAPCHSASGSGGALSYGRAAPSLAEAKALEVGAAVRTGPSQMPVFGPDVLSPAEVNNIAAYVEYLRKPEDPGGLPIGRIGPVPEGFVAWFFGAGALLAIVAWIGTRAPTRKQST